MSNELSKNTWDLIFTTESGSVSGADPIFVLGNIVKGHLVILFDFILNTRCNYEQYESFKFLYNKANYKSIFEFISNVDLVNLFQNLNVQQMFDELIFYSGLAFNQFIPIFDSSKTRNSTAP